MVHIASSELVLETFCRAVVVERRLAALLRESDPLEDTDFAAWPACIAAKPCWSPTSLANCG
jgi:hypothetical protein